MKNIISFFLFTCLVINCSAQNVPALDARLSTYTYPFPVQFQVLQNQGQALEMFYMDVKPQNANGKTVLLLHGKNFNGAYWKQTAMALADKGFRVIIPDQIGFGKSSKPQNYQYSFQQLGMNTKSILDTLRIKKFMVLGHSMGGMLATKSNAVLIKSRLFIILLLLKNTPDRIRTYDAFLRTEALYPAELRRHIFYLIFNSPSAG